MDKKSSIIYKKVDELIPYINNPRDNDNAVDAVASSIKNFGFKVPIVIDSKNEIINGHTRLKASKKLGIEEVPCIIADDLTDAQVKAFRLADNKVGEIATWDLDLLEIELKELENELDIDMLQFGFEEIIDDVIEEEVKKPDVEFTEELNEESNYLVLKFDNSVDWVYLQSLYPLKTVKALDSKESYERKGIGRVVDGVDFLNKITGNIG